jgi:hypothetical protein
MEANGGFGIEFRPRNRCAAALPVRLSGLIPGHVTMQTKNMHDVFGHHGIASGGSILQSGAFGSVGWLTKGSTPAERLNTAFKFERPGGNRSRDA